MNYGDITIGETVDFLYPTSVGGVPTTLLGSPSLAVYEAGNATEITAGCTITADYDSKTGSNRIQVAATTGNGFSVAKNYTIMLMAGTLGGVSVAPRAIAIFSIANRNAMFDAVDGIEVGMTFRQAVRGIAAILFGKVDISVDENTQVYRNAVADSKARITATVNADDERTAITTDLT